MKLVLHNYWRSSASHRVRIALGLKQLAYEYVVVNILHGEQLGDAYRAMNPVGQVPTLEISDDRGARITITQSLPIIEYLEERWPERPILPKDLFLRARARALAEIVNSGIQPLQNLTTTKAVKKLGGNDADWVKPWIANGLAAYEKLASETSQARWSDQPEFANASTVFSVGNAPTIADCCLIPQLASARRFGVDYAQHELLVTIERNCLALPAFAAAAPDQQPDAAK